MPALRLRDIHEMVHLFVTASGIIEGFQRAGFRPLGLLRLPLMDIEPATLLGAREGLLSTFFKGEGPIRNLLRGTRS